MDLFWGIVQAGIMTAFVIIVMALLAGLFMIVFRLAVGIGRGSGNS